MLNSRLFEPALFDTSKTVNYQVLVDAILQVLPLIEQKKIEKDSLVLEGSTKIKKMLWYSVKKKYKLNMNFFHNIFYTAIVEKDSKFSKQIGIETVIIERPGKCQKKGTETLVLKDVRCINDSLIRYQKSNAKKILTTLKNGLRFSDISSGCGVTYFMKQWNNLKEKYQK